MALHKFDERQFDLKFYTATKTSAAHRHASVSMARLAFVQGVRPTTLTVYGRTAGVSIGMPRERVIR